MNTAIPIQAGVDDTDHIAFFCGECGSVLKVEKVHTDKVVVRVSPRTEDKCTWVHCVCPKHGRIGWRKFYWTCDDGGHEYDRHRTDGKTAAFPTAG
jgi:hypothetical protein